MDFFAALICSPEIAKPSQYLPGFWGGEMAHDEAVADRKEAQDIVSALSSPDVAARKGNDASVDLHRQFEKRAAPGRLPPTS